MSTPSPSSSPPSKPTTTGIPDLPPSSPPLPLTMTSSLLLTALPRDSSDALSNAFSFPNPKITVRFQPIGSAPLLRQQISRISAEQRFETVVTYLRRVLKLEKTARLLPDLGLGREGFWSVANVEQCFKDSKDQLIVSYSMTPAFG
ncbi:hypothetical protein CJF30_00008034 [Rutstroemia sp. NJR-2017a BBW]|nr:hypothetical protein CJF30_00008034 [Rutstroemia sp. NJR-2017a BBW]